MKAPHLQGITFIHQASQRLTFINHSKRFYFSLGDLLKSAEDKGYQIFVTTVRNLRYQLNLRDRQIAIVVLLSTSWPKIRTQTAKVCDVINAIKLGDYAEISI